MGKVVPISGAILGTVWQFLISRAQTYLLTQQSHSKLRNKDIRSHRNLHTHIYNSFPGNCPELDITQCLAAGEQVNKQWPLHTTNTMRQWKGTCDDMDKLHMHPAKWEKPDSKRPCPVGIHLYDILERAQLQMEKAYLALGWRRCWPHKGKGFEVIKHFYILSVIAGTWLLT